MMRAWRLGLALFLGLGGASLVHGADGVADAGADAEADHWRSFGYFKAMYVADDKKGGRLDQHTFGVGGKIGGATPVFRGFWLQGAWYVTSDLGTRSNDPRQTDAYMFDVDKTPYSLLGEAQLRYQAGSIQLTLGRQEIHSPLINSYDYRIIPNLFEAYTLASRALPETTLSLAYVDKMSGLDSLVSYKEFLSMSRQAYTSLKVTEAGVVDSRNGDILDLSRVVGKRGVWLAGAVHEGAQRWQLWNSYGPDTFNTLYLDGRYQQPLSTGLSAHLEAQAYRVDALGGFKDYLKQQGLNGRYALFGLRGTLIHPASGLSLALAGNQFTGNADTVTAYGNWGGYPEFVSMPYMYAEGDRVSAIARSRLARATLLVDLGAYGLKDQSLQLGHARIDIDEAILARSDIRVNTLLYRAKLAPGLSARLLLEARESANARYDNEFVTLSLRYDY